MASLGGEFGSLALLRLGGGVGAEAVLGGLLLNLLVGELGKLVRRLDVADVLGEALGEDDIDLLQTAVGGLGVEEPDHGDEQGVQDGEEQISSPASTADHGGREHDDCEVEQPVGAGGHSVGLGTGLDGRQLSRVQPGQRQPGGTEGSHVQEKTEHGTLGDLRVVGDQTGEGDDHGDGLQVRATQEQLAATDLLNEEPREGSEDGVHNHVDTTDEQSLVVGLVQGALKQNGQVVDDSVATRQLLEDLGRGTDKHAAEVLGATTGAEVAVAGLVAGTGTVASLVTLIDAGREGMRHTP